MGSTLIECENVQVRSRRTTLLGPISMTVEAGDFWGIVGPNGAGKSTLLRVLAGGIHPYNGSIRHEIANIGYLLQHHDYSFELPFRVRDVVGFGVVGASSFGPEYSTGETEAIDSALGNMGLEQMGDRLYRELSGGERRKVQFARLAAQGADLALLDEPTAGLDLDWQERVTNLAARFHVQDCRTVVMVTHDVDRLPDCTNKVLLLKDGKVLESGAPAKVLRNDLLTDLYGCSVEVVERDGRYHAFSSARVSSAELRR